MGVQEIRDVVPSLFIMLNKETYVLFRIEFLVVLVTVMFLVMFIMDIFRRHIRNTAVTVIFNILGTVSDSIVFYLLGAMAKASFTNQLFPVWALVLVSIRYNIDFISDYGVHDRHGRRFREWSNVVKLLGTAFLMIGGSRFTLPLWSLLALLMLRSWYRLSAYSLALRSVWHGKSSEVVTEYMRAGNWKPEECKPENDVEGYKYLVHGETHRRIKLKKPRYVLCINADAQHCFPSPVTLDKIWGCRMHQLHPDNNKRNDPADFSLAFALSRLLRCRLEDVTLPREIFCINRKLVKTKILEEQNIDRATLNQEDTAVNNGQPEQSENRTYGKEESSHPADGQTRTSNQNNGKQLVLDGNSNQMEEVHKKQKEEEKICRAAIVQYRITKAAPILTIQLKRFDYVHSDRPDKLEERVIFQDTLDITKFMDPGHLGDDEYKYRLVAVIVHNGPTLREGHNFTYVRASQIGCQEQESRGTPSWFRASDESITQVSLEEVLECQAYILFYERVEDKPVLEEHSPTDH